MRRTFRSVAVVFVAMLGAISLAVASAITAALAYGAATALIVPGTGTHDIATVTGYKENAADRYINPSGVACTSTDGCGLVGVDYPASFFPLVIFPGWCPGLKCDTWNKSVGTGVTNLNTALNTTLSATPADQDIILFGYSQGGAVVSREMYNIPDSIKNRVSVVTIGNINNPLGLWSRLSFLPTIPGLDISFGPQLPTSNGIESTNYSFEYDPVGDAPQYWGNALALLNAVVALEYVHGYYLAPNSNAPTDTLPYGYTYGPNGGTLATAIANAPKRTYGDATFVLIPQQGALPLYQPLVDIGKQTGTSALIKPLVALVNPVTKLLVNLGYDRTTNPGIARTLSLLPFNPFAINPVQFSVQFVQAIAQGIHDALGGGASLTPATTTPTTATVLTSNTASPSLVAAKVVETQLDTAKADKGTRKLASVSKLSSVSEKPATEHVTPQAKDLAETNVTTTPDTADPTPASSAADGTKDTSKKDTPKKHVTNDSVKTTKKTEPKKDVSHDAGSDASTKDAA